MVEWVIETLSARYPKEVWVRANDGDSDLRFGAKESAERFAAKLAKAQPHVVLRVKPA